MQCCYLVSLVSHVSNFLTDDYFIQLSSTSTSSSGEEPSSENEEPCINQLSSEESTSEEPYSDVESSNYSEESTIEDDCNEQIMLVSLLPVPSSAVSDQLIRLSPAESDSNQQALSSESSPSSPAPHLLSDRRGQKRRSM